MFPQVAESRITEAWMLARRSNRRQQRPLVGANRKVGHTVARIVPVFGGKPGRSAGFQGATAGEAEFTIWLTDVPSSGSGAPYEVFRHGDDGPMTGPHEPLP